MTKEKPWYHKIDAKELTLEDKNQILKYETAITGHENSIRKWESMIAKAREAIQYNRERILDTQGLEYYVYVVFVDTVPMYVGKGKKDRYKHAVSGCSSCVELNKDYFAGKYIEVMFAEKGLSEQSALNLEADWIYQVSQSCDFRIYNKQIPEKADYKDECMSYFYYNWFEHAVDNSEQGGVVIARPKNTGSVWDNISNKEMA
ncbi:hypothetical protein D3C71_1585350 [compost metagenome]